MTDTQLCRFCGQPKQINAWCGSERCAERVANAQARDVLDWLFRGTECGCWSCVAERQATKPWPESLCMPFVVCPDCGNKRCPRATHHDHDCTGSNDPNQTGSRFQYGETA